MSASQFPGDAPADGGARGDGAAAHDGRLRPLIGAATGLLIGTGVAIGSGIFRNPQLVAQQVQTPALMLAAWLFGGLFFTLAGLLTAELATRYPRTGGEYIFLRQVYGPFVAFFFGWGYTVFVVGGGVATMAVAFGDFTRQLLQWTGGPAWHSGAIGATAVAVIAGVNLLGLRAGAGTQNLLTLLKVGALLTIVVVAAIKGRPVDWFDSPPAAPITTQPAEAGGLLLWLGLFGAAMMPVMWCYEGTTDSVKMTEEIRDPRRAMPIALVGAGLLVTCVYLLLNWAFLRVLTPAEMGASKVVPAEVFTRWAGPAGEKLALLLAMGVVLGGISSAIVSCVRVTYALARDGMAFSFLGRMSADQAPVGALLVGVGFAIVLALSGAYRDVLTVYTMSTGLLFGLVNLSLFIIRLREWWRGVEAMPIACFRCPAGMAVSLFLAGTQFAIAAGVAWGDVTDYGGVLTKRTLLTFLAITALYLVWPKPRHENRT